MTAAAAVPAASGGSPLWYLSRGTGFVVLALLTLVLVLGVLSRRGAAPGGRTFVLTSLHRNASLLAVGFLAVHVVTAVLDPYAPIRLLDVVVPFRSAYRPVWLGLGAVAFDLLVALVATSLLRLRMGVRWWRGIHWSAYLAWPVALVHAAGTGTDTSTGWGLMVVAGCVVAVVAAVLARARMVAHRFPGRGALVRTAAVGAPLIFAGWLVAGPLEPGWAARAGTPAGLLASARTSGASSGPGAVPAGSAGWTGQAVERDDGGEALVVLRGALSGGPGGTLQVRLAGAPAPGGGVELSSGTVTLSPRDGTRWAGPVTGLDGTRIEATLTGPAGGRASLTASVQLGPASRLTGTVVVR